MEPYPGGISITSLTKGPHDERLHHQPFAGHLQPQTELQTGSRRMRSRRATGRGKEGGIKV